MDTEERVFFALIALCLLLAVAIGWSCIQAQRDCRRQGGTWEKVGTISTLVPMGNTLYPQTSDEYGCLMPPK